MPTTSCSSRIGGEKTCCYGFFKMLTQGANKGAVGVAVEG
jgi:hypothetical protein